MQLGTVCCKSDQIGTTEECTPEGWPIRQDDIGCEQGLIQVGRSWLVGWKGTLTCFCVFRGKRSCHVLTAREHAIDPAGHNRASLLTCFAACLLIHFIFSFTQMLC